jgi:hypothetical protein
MTEKTVNYTDEMVARLHDVYDGSADEDTRDKQVSQLSEELDRSPASIRAKLTREGIYVPKAKAPAGKNTVRKADLVGFIAKQLNVHVEAVESLEKANKSALARVAAALKD